MAIFKMDYLNKTATEITMEFMKKGYILSNTMSGHQGEKYKVDLYKNNEVIRIRLDNKYLSRFNNEIVDCNVYFIIVEKFYIENAKNKLNKANYMSTLWNDKGEKLLYLEYFVVKDNYRDDIIFCDSIDEIKEIIKKQECRCSLKYSNEKNIYIKDNNKLNKIINIVNSKKGYKSVKKNQIEKICVSTHNKRKYYKIVIKDKNNLNFYLTN